MENPLLKKLQIKPGFKVKITNAPANFNEIIGEQPNTIEFSFNEIKGYDALLIFAITKAELNAALEQEGQLLNAKTICWIFYPKAKTKLASDLNLMQSWEDLKQYELTPCGSAAVNEIWTVLRIKPVGELKRSGLGNAEIQTSDYSEFIDVKNKVVTLPPAVEAALTAHKQALSTFEKLAYSHKKEYVLWILSAKQEKTRLDRIEKMVEKLAAGKKNPSEKN